MDVYGLDYLSRLSYQVTQKDEPQQLRQTSGESQETPSWSPSLATVSPFHIKPTVESSGIGHGAVEPQEIPTLTAPFQAQASVSALGFFHVDLSPPFQALTVVLDHLSSWKLDGFHDEKAALEKKYLYRSCLKMATIDPKMGNWKGTIIISW